VIYPFVNDLVRAIGITGGDEKKTGYYVGIVVSFPRFRRLSRVLTKFNCVIFTLQESVFYAAEALTVIQWGRASDSIGRRPILLGGMVGLTISMLGFGLSKTYSMLILSRCAQGVFNGNIGVSKSVISEITDVTNAPQAFSFLPVAWSIGSTLGRVYPIADKLSCEFIDTI
jgi:MFS family permease